MSVTTVPHYCPNFLQQFWSSNTGLGFRRVHEYDVYANKLSEVCYDAVKPSISIFQDLIRGELWPGTQCALCEAEISFLKLQRQAEGILTDIISAVNLPEIQCDGCKSIPIHSTSITLLIKYLVFLRFRNSPKYSELIHRLFYDSDTKGKLDLTVFGHLFSQVRCMIFLKAIARFLGSDSSKRPTTWDIEDPSGQGRSQVPNVRADLIEEAIDMYCWNVADGSDIVIGVTSDQNVEFLLPDGCYGTLDESFGLKFGDEDVDERDFFFPILPTVAVYILGTIVRSHSRPSAIALDYESELDVHLRNAMILSAAPRMNQSSSSPKLYFSSLSSITRSLSSYDEFRCRWIPELFADYSRLKQRCRQKFLTETVTKKLVVKGAVVVTDLTDYVTMIGKDAVGGGAFSDVWKGEWRDQLEGKKRAVAVKILRLAMVQNEKEKLLKRLEAEVLAWHYLCHLNVSQLYGIVQSENRVGMVSAWCEHGTIRHYLNNINPGADRMQLMYQIASGVAYLHDFNPTVIHGDLKGSNILIDHEGYAIISDFGLSKVMLDFSASSFFAGSIRWMAPEIVRALADDRPEANLPQVTTASDVYAFGSVCLEVMTGALPYPCRKHDPGVMMDIMRGIKPSVGATMPDCKELEVLLNMCWNETPALRPKMEDVLQYLTVLNAEYRGSIFFVEPVQSNILWSAMLLKVLFEGYHIHVGMSDFESYNHFMESDTHY